METAVRERFERIEAILDGVAKKQAAAEARMDRSDARFEKRMRGFENLVRIGMKELSDLKRAQQRTEASLRAFLDSMRKGGNGHSRGH
jgi:hypothetical protein